MKLGSNEVVVLFSNYMYFVFGLLFLFVAANIELLAVKRQCHLGLKR
jgi:hypothetical protein